MLINAFDVVVGKELHVFAQDVEVGEGGKKVRVVSGVIPNVDVFTNFAPPLQCIAKRRARGTAALGKRMCKVAGNAAKTNANIGSGLCNLRGLLCVSICQGINGYVGIVGCDIIGNSVYKTEECSCGATFLCCNCLTAFALAVVVVVVLRYGQNSCIGVLCQNGAHVFQYGLINIFIGQTGVGDQCGGGGIQLGKLTDGVNNQGSVDPKSAAEIAALYGIRLYTIGLGTRGMAPYPFRTPFGGVQYQNVPVEIDEALMTEMAESTNGGQYFRATNKKSLENIFSEIDKMEKTKIDVTQYNQTKDEYLLFLIIGLMSLGLEIILGLLYFRSTP